VAVTFHGDSKPLATDTVPPYRLTLRLPLARAARLSVRATVVRADGSRASSAPLAVEALPMRARIVASPTRNWTRAREALARGGVVVKLLPGRYPADELHIGSGGVLLGSGPETVLAPRDSAPYEALIAVQGSNVLVSDLALDGAGRGGGPGDAVLVMSGSSHVRLRHLTVTNVRTVGVYAAGAYEDVSVEDSSFSSDGQAVAGIVAEGSTAARSMSVARSRMSNFRFYGIYFALNEHGSTDAAMHALALDNVVTDINDPNSNDGTHEGGIWTGGVEAAVIGNVIRRTGVDGIETIGSSLRVSVVGNRIRDTPVGIYLEHSTIGSLFARNEIVGAPTGINVEWTYGGTGSSSNTFYGNSVSRATRAGVFVEVGSDGNTIEQNTFTLMNGPAIVLQGSSNNIVRGNRLCGSRGAIVWQRSGLREDRREALPSGNQLRRNSAVARCSA
jgi:parallel beta-helix repeat protein